MLGEREIWRHCGQAVDGGMLWHLDWAAAPSISALLPDSSAPAVYHVRIKLNPHNLWLVRALKLFLYVMKGLWPVTWATLSEGEQQL